MSTESHNIATLEGLLDYCESFVRDYWKDQGPDATFMPQIVAVEIKAGKPLINLMALPDAMSSEESKAAFCKFMRNFLREQNIGLYCMMTESWIASYRGEGDEQIMPSQRPDRREAMMLVAADHFEVRGRTLEMRRGQDKRVVALAEMPEMNDMGALLGGRFATMLWPDKILAQPLSDEALSGFSIALNLMGAKPERIDNYEATLRLGQRIWGVLQSANDAARKSTGHMRELALRQLAAAAEAGRMFIEDMIRGWDRRDGTDCLGDTYREVERMKAARKDQ